MSYILSGDVDGNGLLAEESSGSAEWLIIPKREAIPSSNPVYYDIGGTFSYRLQDVEIENPLWPDTILVYPEPQLEFKVYSIRGRSSHRLLVFLAKRSL